MTLLHALLRRLRRPARRSASRPVVEECEAKLLYAADPIGLAGSLAGIAEVQTLESPPVAAVAPPVVATIQRVELVVIDGRVEDRQALLDDLAARSGGGVRYESVVVAGDADGLAQVSAALAGRRDIAALHIVSHGDEGRLLLGRGLVDGQTLTARADEVAGWAKSLAGDADILLYACRTGAGEAGRALVEQLAQLSAADVAASDDSTGAAAAGSDWLLEIQAGAIDTAAPFSAGLLQAWQGTLATFTVTSAADTNTLGTLRYAIDQANANGAGADIIVFDIAGTGAHVITLTGDLPTLTGTVTIDGTTQAGWVEGSFLPVVLDGSHVAGVGLHLSSTADGSTIRGVVIRGMTGDAIRVDAGSDGHLIAGNFLGGLDADGSDAGAAAANGGAGVYLSDASNVTIGGTAVADRNLIAGNSGAGIVVAGATADANRLLGNSIVGNGGIGIDLGDDGVSANDASDTDTGPNGLQNFPVLAGARTNGSTQLLVSGGLNSTPNSYFRIEFFASAAADGSGHGEGQIVLGHADVATDGSGNASFDTTLAVSVAAGRSISATATRADAGYTVFGATSEFASNTPAQASNIAPSGADRTIATAEDAAYTFAAADFGFVDSDGNGLLQVWIDSLPASGALRLNGSSVGAGSAVSASDLAAGLLSYTPPPDAAGTALASIASRVQDDGGTLAGGQDTEASAHTITIDVAPVNDAPVNLLPADQVTAAATPLLLSSALGRAIRVFDVDAEPAGVQLSLSVAHGTLSLAGSAGLNFSTGDGSADATMVFSGTLAAVNAALDGMSYASVVAYQGDETIAVSTSDLGHSGSGGTLTDSDSLAIYVGARQFQEGAGGYTGTEDTYVNDLAPATSYGNASTVMVNFLLPVENALLRFDNLFGAGVGQVPLGSTVSSATLSIYVTNPNLLGSVSLHRMLAPWSEASTYNSLGSGVQFNDVEAGSAVLASVNALSSGWVDLGGLAPTVQAWLDGAGNYGFAFSSVLNTTWGFASSEYATASLRPYLSIAYTPPQPAVVTASSGSAAYVENAAAVAIDAGLTLSDADSTQLTGATVTIVGGFAAGQDTLAFVDQSGITGSWDAGSGVLTLGGTASLAQYQAALRSVTYANVSDAPDPATRTVSFVVGDAFVAGVVGTRTVSVTAVNDSPSQADTTLGAIAEDAVVLPGATVGTLFDPGFGDVDAGARLTGVVVTANAAPASEGVWQYSTDAGSSWFAVGSVGSNGLALDTLARLRFAPAADYHGTPTGLSVHALDDSYAGAFTSGVSRVSVDTTGAGGSSPIGANVAQLATSVSSVNDAPVGASPTASAAEDSPSLVIWIGGSDVDGSVASLRIDALPLHGTLYADAALTQPVTAGSSWAPSVSGAGGQQRDLYFVPAADWSGSTGFTYTPRDDLGLDAALASVASLTITAVNDAPVLVGSGAAAVYVEDGVPAQVDAGALVSDIDSADFGGGTLSVSLVAGASAGDQLALLDQGSGAGQFGLAGSTVSYGGVAIGSWVGGSGGVPLVLSLNANADGATVQALARDIVFLTTGDAPSGATRTVRMLLTDGDGGTSAAVDSAVSVQPVNDAPTITAPLSASVAEDGTLVFAAGPDLVTVADADAAAATIQLTLTATHGTLTLAGTTGLSFVIGDGTADATLRVGGSLAAIQDALTGLIFAPTADYAGAASLQIDVDDLGNQGSGGALTATHGITITVTPVNDAPTGALVIGGSAAEYQTLTLATGSIGDADGLGLFALQWLRDGGDIAGATAASLVLSAADIGHQISARVSYTDGGGSLETLTSAAVGPVLNVNDLPTGAPVVIGVPTEDQTLVVDVSSIVDADGLGAFAVQWLRDGSTIVGATATSFVPGDADVGAAIAVRVNWIDGQGTGESLTSAAVGPVANVNDVPGGVPVIVGSATEDQTLTLDTTAITDADGLGSFTVQWLRDGLAVAGANGGSYRPGDADVGARISARVDWIDGQGTAESLTSAAVGPVANVNDVPSGMPMIVGSAVEDAVLVADLGAITDADGLGSFTIQWLRDGVAVGGATGSSYVLGDVDVGARVAARVSYVDGWGTAESLISVATGSVANVNDVPTGLPLVVGTAAEDQVLSVDTTALADADGLGSFALQWLRDGVAIAGAMGTSYQAGDADVGARIGVYLSYVDGWGTTETLTSAPTGAVVNVNDVPMGLPLIAGTAVEDQILTVDTAAIGDADGLGAFAVQWLRDGLAVGGANGGSYRLGDADVGARISARVDWIDGQGTAESLTSAAVGPVANVNDVPSGMPVIVGSAVEDAVLVADLGAIADADGLGSFALQWLRDGVAIAGATGSIYTLGDAEVAATLTLRTTYVDAQGTTETLDSATTAPVVNVNDLPTGGPQIVGAAVEDGMLAVDLSTIGDADGLGAFSVQWLRGGVAIAGAASGTLVLGDADVGARIGVRVAYVDGRGTVETLSTTPSAPVANVNDAPLLSGGLPLDFVPIGEDDLAPAGQTVAALLAGAVSDADPAALQGAAITAADAGNGRWQFSLDGGANWVELGPVSATQALLLRGDDLLRLVPDGVNGTTGTLQLQAWDQTSGNAGLRADASLAGGSTAFSSTQRQARQLVAPVNDAPVVTSAGGAAVVALSVAENTSAVATLAASDVDLPAQGLVWSVAGGADADRFEIDPASGALIWRSAADFEANADADGDGIYLVSVCVTDAADGQAEQTLQVTVTDVNEAPLLGVGGEVTVLEHAAAGTPVLDLVARDVDVGDRLSFTLVDDADGRFALDPRSGQIVVADGSRIDLATARTHDLVVRVTDAQGASDQRTLRVRVTTLAAATELLGDMIAAEPATAAAVPPPAQDPAREQPGERGPGQAVEASVSAPERAGSLQVEVPAVDRDERGSVARGLALRGDAALREEAGSVTPSVAFDISKVSPPPAAAQASAADAPAGVSDPTTRTWSIGPPAPDQGPSDSAGDDGVDGGGRRPSLEGFVVGAMQPARVAGVVVTAGFVWWLTRGSGTLATVLMGVPAWRHIDLLPVLARNLDDEEDIDIEAGDDADLDGMFDRKARRHRDDGSAR